MRLNTNRPQDPPARRTGCHLVDPYLQGPHSGEAAQSKITNSPRLRPRPTYDAGIPGPAFVLRRPPYGQQGQIRHTWAANNPSSTSSRWFPDSPKPLHAPRIVIGAELLLHGTVKRHHPALSFPPNWNRPTQNRSLCKASSINSSNCNPLIYNRLRLPTCKPKLLSPRQNSCWSDVTIMP